jgi:hypothetical protein
MTDLVQLTQNLCPHALACAVTTNGRYKPARRNGRLINCLTADKSLSKHLVED